MCSRAGNVIGGGDWSYDRIIPDLFKNGLNQNIKIRNPNSTRPGIVCSNKTYLYLGSLLLKNNKKFKMSFNIGPKKNLDKVQLN